MTDAEPALSPKAQVQVKFRPGSQVTALTSFPIAFLRASFIGLKSTPSIFDWLHLGQGYDAGDDTGVTAWGSFFWTSLASQILISYKIISGAATRH